jgi:hypothetical protein
MVVMHKMLAVAAASMVVPGAKLVVITVTILVQQLAAAPAAE